MEIIEMPIRELIPYENNPRINDNAVEAVAKSIKNFGFKVPIVIDKDKVIVAGHTRLKAAERLGLKTVPVIKADDLSNEQIRAFRLVDNKASELSKWDFEKLRDEISGIKGVDLYGYGFENEKDFNIEDFFDVAGEEEIKPKMVECPHCGQMILDAEEYIVRENGEEV